MFKIAATAVMAAAFIAAGCGGGTPARECVKPVTEFNEYDVTPVLYLLEQHIATELAADLPLTKKQLDDGIRVIYAIVSANLKPHRIVVGVQVGYGWDGGFGTVFSDPKSVKQYSVEFTKACAGPDWEMGEWKPVKTSAVY